MPGLATRIVANDFTVNLKMRRFFFDRARVENAIGKKKAKALNRGGLFIRQAGRKLLGPPSKKSKPRPAGKPPRTHSSDERATLRNILYHYDRAHDSVIVGPVKLNQVNTNAATLSSLTVPELHEFGGEVIIREEQFKSDKEGKWFRRDLRLGLRPYKRYRERRARYPERKFMGPALQKTLPRVPELFGGTSRGELFAPIRNAGN